jgi:hypothetical protein
MRAIHDGTLQAGARCVLCIRPENLILGEPAAGAHNTLRGRISLAAYLGNTLRYEVDVGNGSTFRTDIGDPWHHEQLLAGTEVSLTCSVASTLAISGDEPS